MFTLHRHIIQWTIFLVVLIAGIYVVSDAGAGSDLFSNILFKNEQFKLKGIWVQAKSITSRERIDELLNRVDNGNFNAVFAIVFVDGRALYSSKIVPRYHQEDPKFDPLTYLIAEAHRREIQVHAWFILGRVGNETDSPILAEHPEWRIAGPEGNTTEWLNFAHPDVKKFVIDLIMEVVEGYEVDGIHLDYLRYPGPEWGFDSFSIEAFKQEFGFDLDEMRYADLPAFGKFQGNPLISPVSAQVLATFSNGVPALMLNQYGQGEVILMNWTAHKRTLAVGSEILQRSILRLLDVGGQVYLLRSETNREKYGDAGFERTMKWLKDLGWEATEIAETSITTLSSESVLVLPSVYLITPETAVQIMDLLSRGGGVIFIDGPTPSIHLEEIQTITGMKESGKYFEEKLLMVNVVEHPLLPLSPRDANLDLYQTKDQRWNEFRKEAINGLLEDIYKAVKAYSQKVVVSVTVSADHRIESEEVLVDWQSWLEQGYIDFLVPRVYVKEIDDLPSLMKSWDGVIDDYDRIIFGISAHTGKGKSIVLKSPEQLLEETRMVFASGSNGVVIFNMNTISDEELAALTSYFSSYLFGISGEE